MENNENIEQKQNLNQNQNQNSNQILNQAQGKSNSEQTSYNFAPSSEFKTVKSGVSTSSFFTEEKPKKKKNDKKAKKEKSNFGSRIVIPFFSGVVGTVLVLGTCLYVPPVRNYLSSQILGVETQSSGENSSSLSSLFNNSSSNSKSIVSLSSLSETGINVASKVQPSIVGITVEYSINSVFSSSSSTASAEGSGIIITEDGYILTNNHVVNSSSSSSFYEVGDASKVTVYLYNDDTPYEGTIVGTDAQTDLAVIKIDKTGLTAAELGDSDAVQVGEFAMAIGNPLGMESSVTSGVISAVDREITDSDGITYTLIQTDAAINSGNSGGALVNSDGEVIGVNFLKVSGTGVEGLGFAIPINDAKDIAQQLIQYNKVKRPYIGISGIDLDSSDAKRYGLVEGVYVRSIEDFSAAQKAGLRIGDVIIAFDGEEITTMNELNALKNKHNIGDEITLTINRSGEEKQITLTLAEQP